MSEAVDEALVARLASLAHLELTAEETKAITRDLESILAYVEVLSSVDVSGTEPLASVATGGAARRPDEPRPSLPRDLALAQAPKTAEGGFVVPAFVDEG